jgi:hypothetical protein
MQKAKKLFSEIVLDANDEAILLLLLQDAIKFIRFNYVCGCS